MSSSTLPCLQVPSYVRDYHAYKDLWVPVVGEVLHLRRERENAYDSYAVAILRADGTVIGHVPYNLAPPSSFLARWSSKGTVEITGEKVNRGAGYGLEIPCIYHLYGPQEFIERLETLIATLKEKELLPHQ